MPKFGDLEAAVMDVLWASSGPRTIREVLDVLAPTRPLAYTTVQTVMDRLAKKGLLERLQDAGRYVYAPTASRDAHAADLMQAALASSADAGSVLLHFVERLEPDQQEALRDVVRRHGTTST